MADARVVLAHACWGRQRPSKGGNTRGSVIGIIATVQVTHLNDVVNTVAGRHGTELEVSLLQKLLHALATRV